MNAPFAEYHVTSVPEGLKVHVEGGGTVLVLDPTKRLDVARTRENAIYVEGHLERLVALGWGGTRNHRLDFGAGVWRVHDNGHGGLIGLNGAWLKSVRMLEEGDRVEPAAGLVFTFRLRDDLEGLEEQLSQRGRRPGADDPAVRDFLLEHTRFGPEGAERALRHFAIRRGKPLHDAVKRRAVSALKTLLRSGLDPNALDESGQPPLRYVLTSGIGFLLEDDTALMISALLGAGADPSLAGVGDALMADANSMVSSALENNHALALARLLGRHR